MKNLQPNEMTEENMSSVNGETLKAMKKGEETSAPGFQLHFWLIGDYNDQEHPCYVYEGATWQINCEDSSLETAEARVKELQSKGVKEIIFPATDTDPEVKISLMDYPKSVIFTRN